MSKKSRRERRPNLPAEAFNPPVKPSAAPSQPATTQPSAAQTAAASVAATPRSAVLAAPNWHREYSEVVSDLKRTALIFAALVVIMIVLSFVIR